MKKKNSLKRLKQITSIVMVLAIVITTMAVGTITSNAAIVDGTTAIGFYWHCPTVSENYNGTLNSGEVTLTILKQSNIPTYRYYYRVVDLSGWDSDWIRVGQVTPPTTTKKIKVSFSIDSWIIDTLCTSGLYSDNNMRANSNTNKQLRIYFTVRGMRGNNFVTGFYDNVYTSLPTWNFCCQTAPYEDYRHWDRTVSVLLPLYSLADDDIDGVRLYYRAKNGEYKKITDINKQFFYVESNGGCYATYGYQIPLKYIYDMKIDSDGDICLTARCINNNDDHISPYYNQYWRYSKFVSKY